MKSKEIKSIDPKELNSKLKELEKELIKLNAQVEVGTQLKNPGQLKQIKKNIARIKTRLRGEKKE